MRVAPRAAWPPAASSGSDDDVLVARVLLGDMSGRATVLDVLLSADADAGALAGFHGRVVAHWEVHPLGRTLGAFWLDVGGGEVLPATADAMGSLKLWRCDDRGGGAELVADAQVAHRVLCASAAPQSEGGLAAILCGDQRGDVTAFGLERCGDGEARQLRCLGVVRRAHAATAVTFAHCTSSELVTAGGDGYMCTFALQATNDGVPDDAPLLVRTGRHHVAAITAIEALHEDGEGGACGAATVAAGVTANDIVLWDLRNACELLRVPCGGWRRPHTCALGDGGRFVVAFISKGVLHVRRRWPHDVLDGHDASGSAPQLASGPHAHRSLRFGHHGREVHTALFVPPPADAAAGTCCALLTGSEDGTLFHVYFDCSEAGAPQLPRLRASSLLAQTTGGTAVRSIALVPHLAGGWFLLSAGAKEVLMCWRLTWQGAALVARSVSAQARPVDAFHRAWRAGAAAPADATGGDQRHLAVCGFVAGDRLYAAVSSSDATLAVWTLPVGASGARWSLCATLRVGHCPVLCLSCVVAPDGPWLVGGATDGTVGVWHLGALTQQTAATAAAAAAAESHTVPEVLPSALLRTMHQSGVNSLSVAAAPLPLAAALGSMLPLWVLVTGGDDQALNALVLQLADGDVQVVAAQRRPNAHASALKSVWTDGAAVLTTSLDQRLRTWCVACVLSRLRRHTCGNCSACA
jgi:WD40 repeat protein